MINLRNFGSFAKITGCEMRNRPRSAVKVVALICVFRRVIHFHKRTLCDTLKCHALQIGIIRTKHQLRSVQRKKRERCTQRARQPIHGLHRHKTFRGRLVFQYSSHFTLPQIEQNHCFDSSEEFHLLLIGARTSFTSPRLATC